MHEVVFKNHGQSGLDELKTSHYQLPVGHLDMLKCLQEHVTKDKTRVNKMRMSSQTGSTPWGEQGALLLPQPRASSKSANNKLLTKLLINTPSTLPFKLIENQPAVPKAQP